MPARKTKTEKKTTKAEEPQVQVVQPTTTPPVQVEPVPQPAPDPAPAPVAAPVAAPADNQVKPELVKAETAIPATVAIKEETPNLDGWVAVNEILPNGQNLKNTFKAGTFILVGLLFGLAIGGGGMWWWSNKVQKVVSNQTNNLVKDIKKAVGASTPTPSPSITPATGLTQQNISLFVQNGSGVRGAAAVAADTLEKLGYRIIGTGNATGGPYEVSQLKVKKDKSGVVELLQDDLSSDYQLAKTVQTLEETATYDAVLIVGKK